MAAVLLQGERPDRIHVLKVERPVEMGKQLAAARWLPAQPLSQPHGVDGKKHKVALPSEIIGQGPGDLTACGQVNKAVAPIVGRAVEAPASPRLLQGGLGADLVDRFSHWIAGE